MDYEVDRLHKSTFYEDGAVSEEEEEPSLAEMTQIAINRLEATGKRYCLVVEGSRVSL
jgi:alkaline phosphatase